MKRTRRLHLLTATVVVRTYASSCPSSAVKHNLYFSHFTQWDVNHHCDYTLFSNCLYYHLLEIMIYPLIKLRFVSIKVWLKYLIDWSVRKICH